ncbi:hypothetical protein HPB51_028544 [Rhipicephalus microplus]|uniref:Uncharacterized protein n=1 Tax=Rhipicephalus microplus TaxID=6941 RepID=A0A9J6CWR6_RHIMP|nr:hypothetical protein HPB51_028544 [Rhipicephalus microplus]
MKFIDDEVDQPVEAAVEEGGMAVGRIGEYRLGTDASRNEQRHRYAEANRKLRVGDKQLPLNIVMRDRFECGFENEAVKERLLAEQNLTFQVAYGMAVTTEATAQQRRDIRNQGLEETK